MNDLLKVVWVLLESFVLNGEKTTWESLKAGITAKLVGTKDRAVVINIDRGVEYGSAVKLMDIVNQCDAAIVLATEVDK